MGAYPDATAVFDVDAIGLVNIVRNLNHGLDIGGNPMGSQTALLTGVGANPGAVNLDEEIRRFDWKTEAGAEYVITQPVFDLACSKRSSSASNMYQAAGDLRHLAAHQLSATPSSW
jgi:5,10-methylenetetrahydrofolate reductase